MKPAWDQLGGEYADSSSVIIGDVDCTESDGKPVCTRFGVRGYPTIKYFTGSTGPDGEKYAGGRDFNTLKKFVVDNLGPSCGPDNRDLCDAAQLAVLEEAAGLSTEARTAEIKSLNKEIKRLNKEHTAEVNRLKKQMDAEVAKASARLAIFRSVKAATNNKDEL
jgi:protein disulfide-isomerase A6